jgi:hypothetical protein
MGATAIQAATSFIAQTAPHLSPLSRLCPYILQKEGASAMPEEQTHLTSAFEPKALQTPGCSFSVASGIAGMIHRAD